MKKLVSIVVLLLAGSSVFAQTKWSADPAHTFVNFSVKHLGISFVNGNFKKFEGAYTVSQQDLSDIKITFNIDAASVNTGVEQRDGHLKTDDFLNVEKYPALKFESTSFKKIKANEYLLAGKLTIRDITKDVTFKVVYGGVTKDPWGNNRSGFTATTTINRFDYNVKYDPTGLGVAKDVAITLNLEFVQAKQ
jgi:polyisoprenoid-binding protein YceI